MRIDPISKDETITVPVELPSYTKPPVIETALSVQFKPLDRFTNGHNGLFWNRIREQYPTASDAELVLPQAELFGDQVPRRSPRLPTFRFAAREGAARLQMLDASGQGMVQLQNGRLVYNWRRMEDGEYPRWHTVFPKFEWALRNLETFVAEEELGAIEPNQWEVTYVNHLLKGREWDKPSEWSLLLPGLIGTACQMPTGTTESLSSNWHFVLPDAQGRLHVDLVHGFAGPDKDAKELLMLQLTARGGVDLSRGVDVNSGMKIGHEAIVRAFTAVTGHEAHERWEREK